MNQMVIKRACIFALILGALIGLISAVPSFIGFSIFILSFLTSAIVILFMKKNEKHLAFINNEQGTILGGLIGFCSSIGFFISFCPMVCILHFIFKNYYSYGIPDVLKTAFWFFIIIVLMVSFIFALTNCAVGMAIAWFFDKIEKKPENFDAPLDIEINN